jgi:cysteine synthase
MSDSRRIVTAAGIALATAITAVLISLFRKRRPPRNQSRFQRVTDPSHSAKSAPSKAYLSLIGNTPLVELPHLSKLTGCRMFAKVRTNAVYHLPNTSPTLLVVTVYLLNIINECIYIIISQTQMESMNPGGTGKDRAAKYMIQDALEKLGKGCHDNQTDSNSIHAAGENNNDPFFPELFEGTSGSTGIALACLCNALGLKLNVVMPDDQAEEKKNLLERLGVAVTVVPCAAIANKDHYVNTARRHAKERGGIFLDQFENKANFRAHFEETGPEIWEQTEGKIDAFVMSSGTGGTIAGVSRYRSV